MAIKKVCVDNEHKSREVSILRMLRHPCVIFLKQAFYNTGPGDCKDTFLNLVMKKYDTNLKVLILSYRESGVEFPEELIKTYFYQLLRALMYLEAKGVCHRDVKPENVLFNFSSNRLVLADFGSAKILKGSN